jgi:hypothetical protein
MMQKNNLKEYHNLTKIMLNIFTDLKIHVYVHVMDLMIWRQSYN